MVVSGTNVRFATMVIFLSKTACTGKRSLLEIKEETTGITGLFDCLAGGFSGSKSAA